MACTRPQAAWLLPGGGVKIGHQEPKTTGRADMLHLPCGKCLGCHQSRRREWALRCQLELQEHDHSAFATLTYRDDELPPTLQRRDLTLYIKRLRERKRSRGSAEPIRSFGCGEYGEQTARPHYHLILFGIHPDDPAVEDAWDLGHVHSVPVTTGAIQYVAGYTSKKQQLAERAKELGDAYDTVWDPRIKHWIKWEPPFMQMSRRPGIGGEARKHIHSWRSCAIYNGQRIPVPRFLHEAWKKQATPEQLEQLKLEKITRAYGKEPITLQRLQAQETINHAKQKRSAEKRSL